MYQAAAAVGVMTVVVKHKHGRHLDSGECWIILKVSNKSLGVLSVTGRKRLVSEITGIYMSKGFSGQKETKT